MVSNPIANQLEQKVGKFYCCPPLLLLADHWVTPGPKRASFKSTIPMRRTGHTNIITAPIKKNPIKNGIATAISCALLHLRSDRIHKGMSVHANCSDVLHTTSIKCSLCIKSWKVDIGHNIS